MTEQSAHAFAVREESGNDQLQSDICQRLGHSRHQALRHIDVAVDSQSVVLTGTVPSFYLKQMAQETVRQTCPDRKVHNDLSVTK